MLNIVLFFTTENLSIFQKIVMTASKGSGSRGFWPWVPAAVMTSYCSWYSQFMTTDSKFKFRWNVSWYKILDFPLTKRFMHAVEKWLNILQKCLKYVWQFFSIMRERVNYPNKIFTLPNYLTSWVGNSSSSNISHTDRKNSYYCVISPWTPHKFNLRVIYVLYPWDKEWVTLLEYFNRKMKINWALCFTKQWNLWVGWTSLTL